MNIPRDKLAVFEKELTLLLEAHGIDDATDTPDFILSAYILHCLESYEVTRRRIAAWKEASK